MADITVKTTFETGANGGFYTEGALADVRLLDLDGRIVATKTANPGQTFRFSQLAAGRYRLAPALRPCEGNCGSLDARTDRCQAKLSLVDSIEVTVAFQVESPCRITY